MSEMCRLLMEPHNFRDFVPNKEALEKLCCEQVRDQALEKVHYRKASNYFECISFEFKNEKVHPPLQGFYSIWATRNLDLKEGKHIGYLTLEFFASGRNKTDLVSIVT